MKILPPTKITIVPIKGKGRGVVATQNIKKNEIIEYCPIVSVSRKEVVFAKEKQAVLHFYYLNQPEIKQFCIMLGYGSLYNHSKHPNAEIDYDMKTAKDYLFIRAIKDIKAGEEIVYDYQFDDDKEEFLK